MSYQVLAELWFQASALTDLSAALTNLVQFRIGSQQSSKRL